MIVLQLISLLFVECGCLVVLQELVYSFLLSKRNVKSAKKIHQQQSRKDRFTLSYIKNHTIYPKQFHRFYKIRLWYIFLLIPQFAIFVVFMVLDVFWIVVLTLLLKGVLCLVIGLVFYRGKFPVYDKRCNKNHKN